MPRPEHPDAGDDEDRTEHVEDSVNLVEEREASGDEAQSKRERGQDRMVDEPALPCRRNAETCDHHREDRDVVEREGLLQGVTGDVLHRRLTADHHPHDTGEREPNDGPDGGLGRGALEAGTRGSAAVHPLVGDECHPRNHDQQKPHHDAVRHPSSPSSRATAAASRWDSR